MTPPCVDQLSAELLPTRGVTDLTSHTGYRAREPLCNDFASSLTWSVVWTTLVRIGLNQSGQDIGGTRKDGNSEARDPVGGLRRDGGAGRCWLR